MAPRAGRRCRSEARGDSLWLDANHNAKDRIFEITGFLVQDAMVFCSGHWTETGIKYRYLFNGVSVQHSAFGDDDRLIAEINMAPGDRLSFRDAPEAVQSAWAEAPSLVGGCCLDTQPAFGRTVIHRRDPNTDRLEPRCAPIVDLSPTTPEETNITTMNYILKRNIDRAIVLVSAWAPLGQQYSPSCRLPHADDLTARQFVIQWLLAPWDHEPTLSSDPPEDFDAMSFEFVSRGATEEMMQFAELWATLKSRNVKLPAFQPGTSPLAAV